VISGLAESSVSIVRSTLLWRDGQIREVLVRYGRMSQL
jgi:hypothetical protein